MCGIAGYIRLNNKPIGDTTSIASMLQVQKHRGPDDSGIRAFSLRCAESKAVATHGQQPVDERFEGVLGFNRLSILDLSMNGHQPMVSPDNKVLLTLNGEIYNAFDYKDELESWGYRFKSTTDTELVLALYLKYGFEGMLIRLNGMFAIVVADLNLGEVFIARDRFGIKPMYYLLTDDEFAFSSELKSFRFLENFGFDLDTDKLDEYIVFRNILTGTLLKSISSLQPGHYLTFNHNDGLRNRLYFDINDYSRTEPGANGIDHYSEQLEMWLGRSVSSQLMSDVKLGCQLSGGIDSSIVTWLANRDSTRGNFETVSIVFGDTSYSEEQYIDQVTDTLSLTSHKFLLDSDYYFDNIEKVTWHLETPINHPNTVAIYKLSQRAKEYVTVLLSGEGADEVFGGYDRFYNTGYPFALRKLLHEMKKSLRHPLSFIEYFNPVNRAVLAACFVTPQLAGNLLPGFSSIRALEERQFLYNSLSGSSFDRQVKYEIRSFLPDLLIRQDKMSMAHSIENRVPFLDNEVVAKSFSIPEKYLLQRSTPEGRNAEKYLLKRIASIPFGSGFAFRSKMGFGIPLRNFFTNKRFFEYLNDKILPGIKRRSLFNHKAACNWMGDVKSMKYHELDALWVLVAFEVWASVFLDKDSYDRNT